MEFCRKVDEISKKLSNGSSSKPCFGWKTKVAKDVLSVVTQYPGGITDTILESHLQVNFESSQFNKDEFKILAIDDITMDSSRFLMDRVLQATIAAEYGFGNKQDVSIPIMMAAEKSKSVRINYYPIKSWIHHGSFLYPFIHAGRKFRITDTVMIKDKKLDDSDTIQTCIKLLSSKSAVLVLDPLLAPDEALMLEGFKTTFQSLSKKKDKENLKVLVQVVHIYPVVGDSCEVVIRDKNHVEADLVFFKTELAIAKLFKAGDILCLVDPYMMEQDRSRPGFGFGPLTFIFILARTSQKLCALGQKRMFLDQLLHHFPDDSARETEYTQNRVLCAQIPNRTGCSVSIFGRVVFQIMRESDRGEADIGLRIQDESGFCDLILVHQCGQKFELGDFLFFFDLEPIQISDDCWGLMSLKTTSIVNISTLPGILASSSLHSITFLADANSQDMDFFYCRVFLSEIKLEKKLTFHAACGNLMEEDGGFCFCPSCLTFAEDVNTRNIYKVVMDDGTLVIQATISEKSLERIKIQNGRTPDLVHMGVTHFNSEYRVSIVSLDPPLQGMAELWKANLNLN